MTTDLYPYLIIIGSSILIASARLLYQYRKQSLRGQELIRLNEQLGYDLPDFLRECWPSLHKGGFSGFSWNLDWFGTSLTGQRGEPSKNSIEREFLVREVALDITLYFNRKGWEQRHFRSALAESFFLLVQMNIWIKLGTVQGAFDQASKMSVFLQHDVKNMVQLMSLSVDQIEQTPPGQEQQLVNSLRETLPAVRDRAQHMLDSLGMPTELLADFGAAGEQRLHERFRQMAALYDLPLCIVGEASVAVDSNKLQSIIDNVLVNYSYQQRKSANTQVDLHIELEKVENTAVARIYDKNAEPCLWPERLFEPFWSERGSGRGIGLYQAKHQAVALGGDLYVTTKPHAPVQFVLRLPLCM